MRTLLCWVSFVHVILVQTENRLPPHITSQGKLDRIFRQEDNVELECIAGGSPTPEYNWTKNGSSLDMAKPNIRRLAHGTIVIENAGSLDQGSYQCHAFNKYGATMSVTYVVRMAFLTIPSGANVTTVEGVTGESLKLRANHPPCFPVGNFAWEIAQSKFDTSPMPLIQSRRIQVDDLVNLLFANLDVADGSHGLYRSTIDNNLLDIKSSSSYFNLTVKQAPAGPKQHKPELLFFSTAKTVVALEKRNFELRCIFSGNPDPTIFWTRQQLDKTRFKISDFSTRFTISNVEPEDAGDYDCQGSNTVGDANYTTQIIVQAAPEFRSPTDGPYNRNVTAGEDFKVNCNAYAKPEARIDWFINTVKLDTNKLPPRLFISDDIKSLTISRVQFSDLMVIQCNASNKHGYAFGAGYLNVVPSSGSFRVPQSWLSLMVLMISIEVILQRCFE